MMMMARTNHHQTITKRHQMIKRTEPNRTNKRTGAKRSKWTQMEASDRERKRTDRKGNETGMKRKGRGGMTDGRTDGRKEGRKERAKLFGYDKRICSMIIGQTPAHRQTRRQWLVAARRGTRSAAARTTRKRISPLTTANQLTRHTAKCDALGWGWPSRRPTQPHASCRCTARRGCY